MALARAIFSLPLELCCAKNKASQDIGIQWLENLYKGVCCLCLAAYPIQMRRGFTIFHAWNSLLKIPKMHKPRRPAYQMMMIPNLTIFWLIHSKYLHHLALRIIILPLLVRNYLRVKTIQVWKLTQKLFASNEKNPTTVLQQSMEWKKSQSHFDNDK